MDLSPGSATLPRTLRAGRTITWDGVFILRSIFNIAEPWEDLIPAAKRSGHRLGFRGGLAQNVGGHFFQFDIELEHRRFGAAPPARHFPVQAYKLHVRVRGQVKQQRRLATIKLLWI